MLLEVFFISMERHLKSHYLDEDLKNQDRLFHRKETNCFSLVFSVRLFRNWEVCLDNKKFGVLIFQWKMLLTCIGRNWDVRYVNFEKGKKTGTLLFAGLGNKMCLNIVVGISQYHFCTTFNLQVYTV